MYNIYGGLISENRMENGHSVDYSSSDGKLDAYTCVTSTVDWYTCHNGCDYNYTEVTTTCGWESYEEYYCDDMGCTDNQTGGTESLNFGDYTPPNTFQCSINTVEDLNGNCVEKPCSGNPLLDMEISQWNADKNSNRQGCARFKVNSVCDGNSDRRRHWGIDLKAPMLTNIYSVTGGLVYSTGTSTTLGNHIIIKNGNDYHLYAHLNELPNITGLVETGAVIGRSGDSGNAKDEPHLHYEVKHRSGTEPYNSMSFKDPEEFLTAKYDLNGNLISICN
jgi:murein DD-endopeptidase MepM/ murein hydrolase activator NlpD